MNRTEPAVRLEATDVATPSSSNETNPKPPAPPEVPIPPVDPAVIKTQLPLISLRVYKGERKDNACEQ